jgi:phage terminase large subunit-like protein
MAFDQKKAQHIVDFIQTLCTHTKGEWAGKPFMLLPWQKDLVTELFGRVEDPDHPRAGLRQYRTCYAEIPKKSGKSELAAAMALYMLCADGEYGAEVYSAAVTREQASLVYNVAAQMVRNNRVLSKRLKVLDSRKRIVDYKTGSFYQVLSRETAGQHGINPSAIIFDELHAQPTRELWDVLVEGTGYARSQQLVFTITTAGVYDVNSICWEVREHARQVKEGLIEDRTVLPVIYAADKDKDDYTDEAVWARVNPSLGHIFTMDKIREDFKQIEHQPARLNNFLRFRLNMWVNQAIRWLPMDKWDSCTVPVRRRDLLGRTCYGGLDLSSNRDLTAFVLVFPPESEADDDLWRVVCHFYVPENNIMQRAKDDRVPYDLWRDRGFITATTGDVVDYEFIRRDVNRAADDFDLREVAYDPWGAVKLAVELDSQDGIVMVEHRQGYKSMSPPMKELDKLVRAEQIAHGGNPVLRWCADNLAVDVDAAENVKPAKNKARERIDGMVALVMAISRGILNVDMDMDGNDGSLLLLGIDD